MFQLPASLRKEIDNEVRAAFVRSPIVNVSEIAASLQRRYWSLNVAREDIERRTLESATFVGALVLFDGDGEGLVLDMAVSDGVTAEH
ncbi:hypothetical protein [Mesorhizobium sp. IMUNJ 23232]|uniref:hypothetical protein n=1 Tax=Mesorhizobium sp. IMUNJ 23232 TaxID=3376064 RepID=UPI0037B6E5A7